MHGNTWKYMEIHKNTKFTYICPCFGCLDLYFGSVDPRPIRGSNIGGPRPVGFPTVRSPA